MEEIIHNKKAFISDMDGVIYHGNRLLPGAKEFVDWLKEKDKRFLFLTNSSKYSPRELQQKLAHLGIQVEEEHFYTSALATASFLKNQCPNGTAYVIGEAGITNALYDVGFSMNEVNPDYVVVGEIVLLVDPEVHHKGGARVAFPLELFLRVLSYYPRLYEVAHGIREIRVDDHVIRVYLVSAIQFDAFNRFPFDDQLLDGGTLVDFCALFVDDLLHG